MQTRRHWRIPGLARIAACLALGAGLWAVPAVMARAVCPNMFYITTTCAENCGSGAQDTGLLCYDDCCYTQAGCPDAHYTELRHNYKIMRQNGGTGPECKGDYVDDTNFPACECILA